MRIIVTIFVILTYHLVCFGGQNFYPFGKDNRPSYSKKENCEFAEQVPCFDKGLEDHRDFVEKDGELEDYTAPVGTKTRYNVEYCKPEKYCQYLLKQRGKSHCEPGDYLDYKPNVLLPGYTLYCTGTEYKKVKGKVWVFDESKKKARLEAEKNE